MVHGVCQMPTGFYLMGVALRSFFLVLATHLLAGAVDTTSFAGVPLARKISWWCRYYNPLNLSWRYYSMFAYRFTAHSWGTHQLALINHEEHPLSPPLPYIVGETIHPLHVRRLEMAGLLSSQGILTFSAAYQGALAIQYAISTEGIPYLPNITVPLAMVGLFRVMVCKWVATKIHVDAYPFPCMPSPSSSPPVGKSESNACASSLHFQSLCKSSIGSLGSLWASSSTTATTKDSSSMAVSMIKSKENPLLASSFVTKLQIDSSSSTFPTIPKAHQSPSLTSAPIIKLHVDKSSSPSITTFNSATPNRMQSPASLNLPCSQLPSLVLPSSFYTANPPSPQSPSPSVLQSPNRPLLPTISRPYSLLSSFPHAMKSMPLANVRTCNTEALPSKSRHTFTPSLSKACLLPSPCSVSEVNHTITHMNPSAASLSCTTLSSTSCSKLESSTCPQAPYISSPLSSEEPSQGYQMHAQFSSLLSGQPLPYKSNKIVVTGWIGVLVSLVTMSFLPYKVAAAYQLPHRLLQFSIQIFYQYIAVSEFVFHGYLLYQGPRALANRVLFFDHWVFKAQTAGFFCLLMFMLVIALHDFVKHEFYRMCA